MRGIVSKLVGMSLCGGRETAVSSPSRGVLALRLRVHGRAARARAAICAVALAVLAFGALLGPVSGASADSCPNAQFRTGPSANLPDCRAYEMVSPVFKAGFLFSYLNFVAGGSRVQAESVGLVAGATSSGCYPAAFYDLTRTSLGWTTTALEDAPLTQFGYSAPCGSDQAPLSDAGAALLPLHPVSHSVYEHDLYLRNGDGSLAQVGPMLPPSAVPPTPTGTGFQDEGASVAGATPDLSHVLFNLQPEKSEVLPAGITSNLWPGDTTRQSGVGAGMRSLYEYAGTGNSTPALVGVDSGGHLISQCGTLLGEASEFGNSHNAISVDGSTVFFSSIGADHFNCGGTQPPVDEIFARVNQSQTVAISQPSPNAACGTPSCTGAPPADANFEGASQDGSKVFFTSTQQLLDGAVEDGASGDSATRSGCRSTSGPNGCNLYLYDSNNPAGRELVLVSGGDSSGLGPEVQGVAALSEDGSYAYFVARGVLTATPNGQGRAAQPGQGNLYLFERDARFPAGHTVFIATLAPSDSEQWSSNASSPMNVTGDGRFLVFRSTADLTLDDTSTAPQIFRYDAVADRLVRISVGDNGFNNNGNTNVNTAFIPGHGFSVVSTANMGLHPAVSDSGIVVFGSSDALTSQAINDPTDGVFNVYEYRDGRVFLISDGRDATRESGGVGGSLVMGISQSGSDIFLRTLDSLVPQDTDTLYDIYDARVDGGFPAPATAVMCQGDACQGDLSAAPSEQTPGSLTSSGPGNLPPASRPVKPKRGVQHRKKARHRRVRHRRRARLAQSHLTAANNSYGRGK